MKRDTYRLIILLATWKCGGESGRKIRQCVKQLCPSRWFWVPLFWNLTTNSVANFYETLRILEENGFVDYVPIPGRDTVWCVTFKGALTCHEQLPQSDLHVDIFELQYPRESGDEGRPGRTGVSRRA